MPSCSSSLEANAKSVSACWTVYSRAVYGRDDSLNSYSARGKPASRSTCSTISGTVDLSRASSGGLAAANGVLVQIPFGRDAISYVYDSASVAGIENLTIAQLKQVFEGQTPLVINGTTINAVTPSFVRALTSHLASRRACTTFW